MSDTVVAPRSPGEEKVVVLLLPELLGGDIDQAKLRATLVGAAMPIRVLLCLPDGIGGPLAAQIAGLVAGLGVETEILLGPEVPAPQAHAFALRAPCPERSSTKDQIEFALGLADIVMVAPHVTSRPRSPARSA